jgi:hypothetical protein
MDNGIKSVISQIESLAKEFEQKTNSLANEWKDQRKNEFYSKYVSPYNSALKAVMSDLHSIDFQLQNITSKLQTIRRK